MTYTGNLITVTQGGLPYSTIPVACQPAFSMSRSRLTSTGPLTREAVIMVLKLPIEAFTIFRLASSNQWRYFISVCHLNESVLL